MTDTNKINKKVDLSSYIVVCSCKELYGVGVKLCFDSLHPLFKSSSIRWAFFMSKCLCYKDLAHMEYIIYIWMSPTLLARCMNVTAFLVNLGSNLITDLINRIGKKCRLVDIQGHRRFLCVSFILVRLALVIHKSLVWSERLFEDHFFNFFIK